VPWTEDGIQRRIGCSSAAPAGRGGSDDQKKPSRRGRWLRRPVVSAWARRCGTGAVAEGRRRACAAQGRLPHASSGLRACLCDRPLVH
jgi:hypothetical protein